jgi:hypothetical protein
MVVIRGSSGITFAENEPIRTYTIQVRFVSNQIFYQHQKFWGIPSVLFRPAGLNDRLVCLGCDWEINHIGWARRSRNESAILGIGAIIKPVQHGNPGASLLGA